MCVCVFLYRINMDIVHTNEYTVKDKSGYSG